MGGNWCEQAPPKEEKKTGWVKKENQWKLSAAECTESPSHRTTQATVALCMKKCGVVKNVNALAWNKAYGRCYCLNCKTDKPTLPQSQYPTFVSYYKYA